jgi:hypothetical protein
MPLRAEGYLNLIPEPDRESYSKLFINAEQPIQESGTKTSVAGGQVRPMPDARKPNAATQGAKSIQETKPMTLQMPFREPVLPVPPNQPAPTKPGTALPIPTRPSEPAPTKPSPDLAIPSIAPENSTKSTTGWEENGQTLTLWLNRQLKPGQESQSSSNKLKVSRLSQEGSFRTHGTSSRPERS